MSAKLTDEQLRRRSQADPRFVDQSVIDMATELLAHRAERAKPTPSDEERAEDALCRISGLVRNRDHDRRQITNAFASIRAEGTLAERAKLEGALREAREWIAAPSVARSKEETLALIDSALAEPAGKRGDASIRAEGNAERAKLEAVAWAVDAFLSVYRGRYGRVRGDILKNAPMRDEASKLRAAHNEWMLASHAALAQPAERGATECTHPQWCDDFGKCTCGTGAKP